MPWSAVENPSSFFFVMCVDFGGGGLVLECPEPSVTITKGCADPAAVLLSEDRLIVKFPNTHFPPLSTAARLPDLLFMGTLARPHNHTLLCLMFV